MSKEDTTVAVAPHTMDCIKEISEWEKISKKDVVAQAIKVFYSNWCQDYIEPVGA